METHREELTLSQDGTLTINGLPFQAGERVEVVIQTKAQASEGNRYPLRGLPVTLFDPFEPVADSDWEAAG